MEGKAQMSQPPDPSKNPGVVPARHENLLPDVAKLASVPAMVPRRYGGEGARGEGGGCGEAGVQYPHLPKKHPGKYLLHVSNKRLLYHSLPNDIKRARLGEVLHRVQGNSNLALESSQPHHLAFNFCGSGFSREVSA